MNKSAFLKLIQQVSNISDQQNEELEKVAATFPYCQTAHLLLAKSAYDKGSMLSTQRLRRASSYATDRQLLKRVIYTSPVPAPEFVEPESQTEEVSAAVVITEEPSAPVAITEAVPEETLVQEEQESLEEVYLPIISEADPLEDTYTPTVEEQEEVEPEGELDSELALLFTFNSISSSSTDLLSVRSQPEIDDTDALPQLNEPDHFAETTEALSDLEETTSAIEEVSAPAVAPEETIDTEPAIEPETESAEPEVKEFHSHPNEAASDLYAAEEEETAAATAPEEAEIIYSMDEIDRLYAEDSIGYWMGTSRMGEVLQLKDDYTRQRPQSFHPELILEYSKTHELEKAIQPDTNVLSNQLDIIDQFLKLNPRLKTMANLKLKPEPQEDLSLKSSKIRKGTASESLAAIFLKQGKTKKAIKIYEQLILKYPEKKSYFAEQIEKLQNVT